MLSVDDSVHLVAVGLTGLKQFWQRIQNCSSPMFKFAQNICLSLPSWFFLNTYSTWLGFPGGSEVKASAYNVGVPGSIPSREDPLEKEMATHSNVLAWKIPWMEEPGRLQSMGSQSQTQLSNFTFTFFYTLHNATGKAKC